MPRRPVGNHGRRRDQCHHRDERHRRDRDAHSVDQKVLNGTLVMQLVDEGRVELAAPLKRYFPDFRSPIAMPPNESLSRCS